MNQFSLEGEAQCSGKAQFSVKARRSSASLQTTLKGLHLWLLLMSVSVIGLVLPGCGPIYDTRYSFQPPESSQGQSCTFQCEHSRLQCVQLQQYQTRDCEERARRDQEYCQWDLARRGKKEKWYECGLDSCSSDEEQCASLYRSCYQACGGRVTSEEVCVMNCDQVPRK